MSKEGKDIIIHPGIVQSAEGDTVQVMILAQSACSHCDMKSLCAAADMKEKIIEARNNPADRFEQGEKVNVVMQRGLGSKAVLIGYFLPFLIVVGALVILIEYTGNEALSGLIALGLLLPYYMIIYKMSDRLKKKFYFSVEKQ